MDVNNLQYGSRYRYNKEIDYHKFLTFASDKSTEIVKSIAYGHSDNDSFKAVLKELGFELKWNYTRKNWNVVLCLDAVRQSDRVDMIVIASCDPQVIPIHEYIKHAGLVSVAVGFNVNDGIKAAASRWYNIPKGVMQGESSDQP